MGDHSKLLLSKGGVLRPFALTELFFTYDRIYVKLLKVFLGTRLRMHYVINKAFMMLLCFCCSVVVIGRNAADAQDLSVQQLQGQSLHKNLSQNHLPQRKKTNLAKKANVRCSNPARCLDKYILSHTKISAIQQRLRSYSYKAIGVASWYDVKGGPGVTASGMIYSSKAYTAAHRSLPIPSVLKVTNLQNGKSVTVIVNDRGPYAKNPKRIIDLSRQAAIDLQFIKRGLATVLVEYDKDATEQLKANTDMVYTYNFQRNIG